MSSSTRRVRAGMSDTSAVIVAADEGTNKKPPAIRQLGGLVERSAVPIFLVLMVLFFAFNPTIGDAFTSSANIQNILANQSVTGLIALGMVVPLVAGYFDLSVAAVAGLSNVTVAALLAPHQQGVVVSVLAGLAVGVVAGAVNGFLVAVLKLN